MTQLEPDSINELQRLLEEIESLAPTREQISGTRVVYRHVTEEEIIEDSLPGQEPIEQELFEDNHGEEPSEELVFSEFQPSQNGPIAAVDCGIVRLGETENGLVVALRSTIVIDEGGESKVKLFRSGPIYLHNQHKTQILYELGKQLGKDDFFVEIDRTNPTSPRPTHVKRGVADDAHQYGDRFRNWLERLTQRIAVSSIRSGTISIDGALTLRTRDTPSLFLENLAHLASANGNSIIAISKQSMLQIEGKPIRFWLNDVLQRSCYRILSPLMRREGAERILGNAYVARFSVLGPTFRMDVKPVSGQSDDEAINQFYSSALMKGGYPDILVRAHMYSYFTKPDVIQLQSQASTKYSLIPQDDVDFKGIFGPFGGRFK